MMVTPGKFRPRRPARLALALAALAAALAAQQPAPQQPAHQPAPKPAPLFNSPSNIKARQTVEQAIAALGGRAYLNFRDRSGSGRIYAFDSRGQLAGPGTLFWSFYQFPDKERIELTKQRDDIYIYNGARGWEVTYRGVRALKSEALREAADSQAHSIDVILRTWAADPQTLMQYQGTSMNAAQQVVQVDFYSAAGPSATVFFDLNDHLPARVVWKRTDPVTGVILEESETFGNYQVFDGVNTPMVTQRFEGDRRLQQRYYQSMSYAPLSPSLFEPPPPSRRR